MIQSRIILALLPTIILLSFPFVSSQNIRGAAASEEHRQLGWLYDLINDLAKEAAENETPTPTAMPTITAVPTAEPTVAKVQPLKGKKKKKVRLGVLSVFCPSL